MDIATAFFIYLLIWWTTLFAVLPLSIEPHADKGQGHDAGAPKFAGLKKKLILNTVISGAILAVIYILVELNVIKWHEWFDGGMP
jgi:predicted secreted protein